MPRVAGAEHVAPTPHRSSSNSYDPKHDPGELINLSGLPGYEAIEFQLESALSEALPRNDQRLLRDLAPPLSPAVAD